MICSECGASLLNPEGGIPLNRLDPFNGEWYIICPNEKCEHPNLWEVDQCHMQRKNRNGRGLNSAAGN